jgi:hypothetical protein
VLKIHDTAIENVRVFLEYCIFALADSFKAENNSLSLSLSLSLSQTHTNKHSHTHTHTHTHTRKHLLFMLFWFYECFYLSVSTTAPIQIRQTEKYIKGEEKDR